MESHVLNLVKGQFDVPDLKRFIYLFVHYSIPSMYYEFAVTKGICVLQNQLVYRKTIKTY